MLKASIYQAEEIRDAVLAIADHAFDETIGSQITGLPE